MSFDEHQLVANLTDPQWLAVFVAVFSMVVAGIVKLIEWMIRLTSWALQHGKGGEEPQQTKQVINHYYTITGDTINMGNVKGSSVKTRNIEPTETQNKQRNSN